MAGADADAKTDAGTDQWVEVARLVFPVEDVEEVCPLYVELAQGTRLPQTGIELLGRRAIHVERGAHASLCTYFNAFPASPWRQYTLVRSVRLTGRFVGRAGVQIWRSSPRGRCAIYTTAVCEGDFSFDLPIESFVDGGFYWLEFTAQAAGGSTLEEASWQVPSGLARADGTFSIGITTFNRAPYCLRQLRKIADAPELRRQLDTVYVVDQGNQLVQDEEGFADVAASLGDQLTLLRQNNLGGSGGFSRSMYETLEAERSGYVLLLDDDAIFEPESARRALSFANFATTPTIVGGGMLHLDRRTILYAQGESVDYVNGVPQSSYPMNQDFEEETLRERPLAHLQRPAEYNGWWMCLIPREALESVGLSLPLFLKWDDIEFAIRAGHAGFPTVSLFGVAVWHLAWHDKNLLRTWEEYFSHRNTTLALLATSPSETPLRWTWTSISLDILLILLFQYSSVHVRNVARREAMEGLGGLHAKLPTAISYARGLRGGYPDAEVSPLISDFPAVRPSGQARHSDVRNSVELLVRAPLELARHCLSRPRPTSRQSPEAVIPAAELSWWQLAGYDSALVTAADGNGYTWVKRDPRLARRLLWESLRTNLALRRAWPQLRAQVRREIVDVTSRDAWRKTFSSAAVPPAGAGGSPGS